MSVEIWDRERDGVLARIGVTGRTNRVVEHQATHAEVLESVDRADGTCLLAAAMLSSLADDLGRYRRLGWWEDDPEEMRERIGSDPGKTLRSANFPTPDVLLKELESEAVEMCSMVVRQFAPRSAMAGRGGIVRMAKVASGQQQRGALGARPRAVEIGLRQRRLGARLRAEVGEGMTRFCAFAGISPNSFQRVKCDREPVGVGTLERLERALAAWGNGEMSDEGSGMRDGEMTREVAA